MVDDWTGSRLAISRKSAFVAIGGFVAVAGALWVGSTQWFVYKGKADVRLQLKDPDSARFEHVAYYRSTGAVCGAVNGKNSFGGYVGFRGFVLERNGNLTISESIGDPGVGTTEHRIAAVQKAIQFLDLLEKKCPGIAP